MPLKTAEPSPDSGREFDEYFRSDERRLINFLLRYGASFQEAEDIVQETMMELFKKWGRIGGTNPAAYARRVAEHKFFRSVTRAQKETEKLREAGWATERRASELDQVILQAEARWYLEAMRKLPYRQKRALAWHVDGISAREIAEQIGQPEATVRSNIRHAKRNLEALLAQQRAEVEQVGRRAGGQRNGQ